MFEDLTTLDGEALQRLTDAVVDAMTGANVDTTQVNAENLLNRLVHRKFSQQLIMFADVKQPFPGVVFELVMSLKKKERLRDLVEAVVDFAPENQLCKAFCEKHTPSLLIRYTNKVAASKANSLLTHVAATGAASANGMRQKLSALPFARTRTSIDLLKKFKGVHKQLHHIDFQLLRVLTKADEAFRKNPSGGAESEDLNNHNVELAGNIRLLEAMGADLPEGDKKLLGRNVKNLKAAVDRFGQSLKLAEINPDEAIASESPINSLIGPVLATLPAYFHARIRSQAEQLPIGEIINGLASVNIPFPDQEAKDGLGALAQLRSRLLDLVSEHDLWQRVDADLRLYAKQPTKEAEWLQDVKELTTDSLADIDGLCGLRATAPWAKDMVDSVKEFQTKLDAGNFKVTRNAFVNMLGQVRNRFREADFELDGICHDLITMDGPLNQLTNI